MKDYKEEKCSLVSNIIFFILFLNSGLLLSIPKLGIPRISKSKPRQKSNNKSTTLCCF